MKKIFSIGVCLLFTCVTLFGQVGTITPSISNTNNDPLTFIQGVDGFDNTLTIDNEPAGTVSVSLYVLDTQDDTLETIDADLNGSNWEAEVDMAGLDSEAVKIVAHYFDNAGDEIDYSEAYEFIIKPEPAAIASDLVDITTEDINDGIASLVITISVPDSSKEIDDDIVGVGGKEFGFEYNEIVLHRDFDMAMGTMASSGSSAYEYQLKAFGMEVSADEINLDTFSNLAISIDNEFNPVIEGHYSTSRNFFDYNFKDATLPLPIKPGAISVGAGLSVYGGFSADCYVGVDNNGEFGFIENSAGEMSTVSIGAKVTGEVRVTGSLFSKHLAGIQASLKAIGRIGASYHFKTQPTFESSYSFGGDLLFKGKVKLIGAVGYLKRKFCGATNLCEANNNILDGVIWPRNNNDQPKSFGDGFPTGLENLLPAEMQIHYDFNSRSLETDSDDFYDIPDAAPQPAFANRGSAVAIAWIESDTSSAHLLFSVLDTLQNRFSAPIEVTSSDVFLADPKVAIGPDGSAVIVWTQNKLNIADVDATYDLDSVVNNLEVAYAVYEPGTGTISYKSKIYDTEDLPASKPGVAISDSGKVLISWLAQDTSGSTDIWYAELVNGNGIWYQSTPNIINDLPGNNYEVQICFTDSVNAIAAWITDSDDDDSTGANQIVASYYDGVNWSNVVPISDASSEEEYNELSMDFNGDYGAIAYTITTYGDEGEELNSIKVETYYQGQWDELNYYAFSDSLSYVRMPRISISDKEFAAISYQTMDIYSEDGEEDAGAVHIALKDLNNGSSWQAIDFTNEIAQDSSVFVWDMDVVLSRDNKLYTLSQEQDTVSNEVFGNHYTPVTGLLFGDPEMGLVLRGLKINDDLTVEDEPITSLPEVPTGLQDVVISNKEELTLLAYPNPFHDELIFDFCISKDVMAKIEIYDVLGNLVCTPAKASFTRGQHSIKSFLGELAVGFYYVKLTSEESKRVLQIFHY